MPAQWPGGELLTMELKSQYSSVGGILPAFLGQRVAPRDAGHSSPCLEWVGALNLGYGWVSYQGKPQLAHRLAYEFAIGAIPEGLVIDHLCRNRKCINPAHLEAVTLAVNTRRAHPDYVTDDMAVCPHGHPLEPGYVIPASNGSRRCARCTYGESVRPYRGPIKDRTTCPQGHPYSGDNLYLTRGGSKVCRTCRRASHNRKRDSRA
jgi:hypothetical protein